MKEIKLTKGNIAFVDDLDYELISQFKWYQMNNKNNTYAIRFEQIGNKRKTILMHHDIINKLDGKVIDHIDRNGLNNQRCNLRVVTQSENLRNCRDRSINISKRLRLKKRLDLWDVYIFNNNIHETIRLFNLQSDALAFIKANKDFIFNRSK